jgi:hypothetical protein
MSKLAAFFVGIFVILAVGLFSGYDIVEKERITAKGQLSAKKIGKHGVEGSIKGDKGEVWFFKSEHTPELSEIEKFDGKCVQIILSRSYRDRPFDVVSYAEKLPGTSSCSISKGGVILPK